MIYVKRVESTLKQGVKAELGPLTVLYGRNGAGKSSIVQAIELATCGYVSDVEGREQVKQSNAISRLFPSDVSLESDVELSDGTRFRWTMQRQKEDGFKRPEHDCPKKVIWPVQELKEILSGDVTSVQAWLEQKVVGSLTEEDVLRAVPPSSYDAVKMLARRLRKYDFMSLAKEAKSTARQLRTDATKTENTVEQMMQNVPVPLMADERSALDRQLSSFDESLGGVTQAQMNRWEEELRVILKKYDAVQVQLGKLKLPTDNDFQAAKTVGTALDLIRTHAKELGLDVCWTCGNTEPSFSQHVERLTQAQSKLMPLGNTLAQQRQLQSELESLQVSASRLEIAIANTPVSPDHRAERDEVFRKIAADDTARKSWQNANSQRAEVDTLRLRADQLTLAAKSLEKAGRDLLDRRKSDFEQQVSRYLPSGDRFIVDIESGRIGLLRDGTVHSALSGAEWSRVLLALAASQTNSSTPSILVPEDRAWDQDTLERVMKALSGSQVQIVLMSTIAPRPVDGWTVIELE